MTPPVDARPRLAEGVRLREDRHEGGTVLLSPEGVLRPNATGAALLALCDGRRTVGEIAAALADTYRAPAEVVLGDVIESLQILIDHQLVCVSAGEGAP
jgi:pyrroloquinoline quinone biosynthesis protein D